MDSKKLVLLFSTIAKLNLQPTQHWSVINSILGRICGVFGDEFIQTLRPPMLSIFRYQSFYGEKTSVRFLFGDPGQLPAVAHSQWNQFSCMRTVLVAVKPIVLKREYRQVPILGDMTSLSSYEGQIDTMRELPADTCPLTVVFWDSDSLPDEIRESSLEAGLVLKLHDNFPWELQRRRCRYTDSIQKACQAFNEARGQGKTKSVSC